MLFILNISITGIWLKGLYPKRKQRIIFFRKFKSFKTYFYKRSIVQNKMVGRRTNQVAFGFSC